MNAILATDFYKLSHVEQYPKDTEYVYSNWTARSTRVAGQFTVVNFGFNYFAKVYLHKFFNEHFFDMPWTLLEKEYRRVVYSCLGVQDPKTDHLKALHTLGYLPLKIYSIPEGFSTPLNCPQIVLVNTLPEFFWLTNYIESLMSCILWKPSTSATTAQRYRKLLEKYALESGETDLTFVDYQGHDFSFRGMSGLEDAILSGLGHLTCFTGTDTIPAILAAHEYYGADYTVGASVPATEHSVMCAGGQDGEFETFERLITEIYPKGILSIVSDTWDLWKVLTEYIPKLRDVILAREGTLTLRPDSGDPVKIMCGDPDNYGPAHFGVLRLLEATMGVDKDRAGLPLINKCRAIYGDSITLERADQILHRCTKELRLSPYNCIFGIGSFTYEFCTRDTYGRAVKATAVVRSGKLIPIFKDPKTDDGGKRSHKGIPAVYRHEHSTEDNPEYFVVQESAPEALDNCAFEKVWENGKLLVDPGFDTIRKRVRGVRVAQ